MKNVFQSFRQDTVIFIDGANLYYSEKTLGVKIDYQRFYNYFSQYHRLIEIRIFLAFDHQSSKDITFIENLEKIGYKVITKKLKFIKTSKGNIIKKGNVDIELALDAFEIKNRFRTFVLFSGDSDFDILLKKLQRHSKRVVVISTRKHIAKELIKTSHKYIDLKKFIDKVKKQSP